MAYGKFESVTRIGYNDGTESRIGANSAAIIPGDAIKMTGEFATLAGAGETIVGVAVSQKTFASDNQTVAAEKLIYTPTNDTSTFRIPILGGTITAADVNKYYDITSTQVVDGTTETTTATGQLQLVKFISSVSGATMGLGEFKVVNL